MKGRKPQLNTSYSTAGRLWSMAGVAAFWLLWPALRMYLARGSRSRVLVISDGYILVVRGWLSSGRWGLPGGGTHLKESPSHSAVRELAEETGLILAPESLSFLGQKSITTHGLVYTSNQFIAQVPGRPALKAGSPEILGAIWILPTALNNGNTTPEVMDLIERARSRGQL